MCLSKVLKYPLLFLFSFSLLGCNEQLKPKNSIQNLHVDVQPLSYTTLRLTTELPGRITAFKEVEVRPQITGIIKSRLFKEGSYVKAGDLLFEIESTSYQSSVNSAKAQLNKALANQQSTQKEATRILKLLKKKLTSQKTYDDANSAYLQAKAEVGIRQADLDYAAIQLSYTKIKAPISGSIGLSEVSEGSLVTAGQSDYITTIKQSDNVYIDMEQSSLSLYKLQKEFSSTAGKKLTVPVSITLEDGTAYEHTGQLEFIDTQVTASTGTVTLRALIPNPNHALLAGMYVRAHLASPEERNYLVVPQSIVVRSQSGKPSIFVVDKNNKTIKKPVVLGNEVGNAWVVKEGLAVGDKVVVNNLIKIKTNQTVIIDSEITTNTSSTPETNSKAVD